ncbi:Pyridine nucleotide-disulfide oxidoreductase, putative [Alloalcanivorax dieselolei B5]|uniref:Pyridine nucleotide-disulfide oxidoreductase, putative n=1 Tax=Alcanivorax dieselolei (strain DSM 16502 / CGMCC 1.3690 / MCCC 1A00001 / B-5) TaxID=930169 RepID=K0CAY2_ALCDB|nr:NAD(P)/FAD-dependent oxidoreductase [Alloalcanivorax dieselolei]AFT68812.1 Pyridine nucleotide-disulfide oxidoreductase, putative [Alloalcanivorax dieselolei B5]GGK06616.1 NADH dehydrogenase [Alloalcanivorax dieselolei]
MSKPKILVVGGGAGGLPLVTQLGRKLGKRGRADITLVDTSNIHVWKPRYHEVATGAIDADLDAVDYRAHARLNHYRFEPGTLTRVDAAARTVTLAAMNGPDGEEVLPERQLDYDYLVLAIGSQSNDFGTPGVRQHCLFMDTRTQAERFRERFLNTCLHANYRNDPVSVAIVGGGATGVELAAEIHHAVAMLKLYGHEHLDRKQLRVTVVEALPRILPALSERVSAAATERLQALGVSVRTGVMVAQATEQALVTKDGEEIKADLMVWAAGVKGPDIFGQLEGFTVTRVNQIEVEPNLLAKGHDNIFVIGDSAFLIPEGAERPIPPRAQSAQQMAHHTARNLVRLLNNQEQKPFEYKDHGSLVSLSNYSSVGMLMGNLKGGNFFVEGWLARIMYVALYRMHQAALYGWPRTIMLLTAGRFSRLVRPRLKLH